MDGNAIMMIVAAALILVSAVLSFLTTFFGKVKKTSKVKEKALEAVAECSEGEFRLKLAKHMKEMESSQKELIEVLKNQNTLLQAQIDNLEHEIYLLSEKQINQAKTIIKYNKENARQLAISERETLEYVMLELKKAIEDNAGAVSVKAVPEVIPVVEEPPFATEEAAPVLEEVSEAELFEVHDLPADEEFVLPDLPAPEEIPDRLEDDFDLSALFDDLAEGAMAEEAPAEEHAPVVEEKKEEPAPAADPLAGFGSDPNAMMTPEDIAKLLEAMGQ